MKLEILRTTATLRAGTYRLEVRGFVRKRAEQFIFIVGAAKGGSSWLHHALSLHPEIACSSPKEPLFFESEYELGIDHYWNTYYKGWKGERYACEGRVAHLLLPFIPERIAKEFPDAQILVTLREPVSRAYSHWWMRHVNGQERLSFEDALAENLRLIEEGRSFYGLEGERYWRSLIRPDRTGTNHRVYLDCGYYAEQLSRYYNYFPASQIHILFFEDIRESPELVIDKVCASLGLELDARARRAQARNVHVSPIAIPLFRLDQRLKLSSLFPKDFREGFKSLLNRISKQPEIPPHTKQWLQEHYRAHNLKLAQLLGRTLDGWNSKLPSP